MQDKLHAGQYSLFLIAHRQLIVKLFYDSPAVLNVDTHFGQKVCTKNDIIFALSIKD
jgi:hypothetical protein